MSSMGKDTEAFQKSFTSEELYDAKLADIEWLAEQMPGGFFIYQAREPLEIIYVNRAACRIFGCETIEEFKALTGNTFRGMVYPEDYNKIQASIDEQISDSVNKDCMDYVVYRIRRKDGSIRWVDDYGHFASMPGYGDVYYVFIGDITETRIAKEEQERNRVLSELLRQSEHANRAKSIFLSDMSHEIRTPINAILGMNEMILRESVDSDIIEYAANIKKAGVSLLGIISDILDISKIEAGRIEFIRDKYSIVDIVHDMYNLIRLRAEEKGLSIEIELDQSGR